MANLRITAGNMLVEGDGDGKHVAALKQSYDGGWTISSDPEPLRIDLPAVTFETREDLIAALEGAGYQVTVDPTTRHGSGN